MLETHKELREVGERAAEIILRISTAAPFKINSITFGKNSSESAHTLDHIKSHPQGPWSIICAT